ncbi:MAG: hypothetical protein K2N06_08840 [Oscillospiraceae bacterium]|nr:hypothetical protein [Oscillospiraceae bacterium]
MKKDEILAKARAEKSDEMENHIYDRSMIWMILGMFVCLCIFSYTRLERDMPTEDYTATLCIAIAVGNIYRFIKLKRRHYLMLGIVFAAVGILMAVIYFLKFFGA